MVNEPTLLKTADCRNSERPSFQYDRLDHRERNVGRTDMFKTQRRDRHMVVDGGDLIWVPAHMHPQIAPSEFVAWIETHGKQYLNHESLPRNPSKLSNTMMLDESMDNYCACLAEDSRTYEFSRYSTSHDDSPVLVPRENQSLSRRSAVSARGRGQRRSTSHLRRQSSQKIATDADNSQKVPPGGIQLYDRPVNVSEWIDLGTAASLLESKDSYILSRVQSVAFPREQSKRQKSLKLLLQPFLEQFNLFNRDQHNKQQTATEKKKKPSLRGLIPRSLSLKKWSNRRQKPEEVAVVSSNRLPLAVERAVYQMSHAKLANPQRPLYHQVLISNFMFWYLSIVQADQDAIISPQTKRLREPYSSSEISVKWSQNSSSMVAHCSTQSRDDHCIIPNGDNA